MAGNENGNNNWNVENEIKDSQIKTLITTTLKKRTCNTEKRWWSMCDLGYGRNQHTSLIHFRRSLSLCDLGYERNQHNDSSTMDTTGKWEFQTHPKISLTDAFGDIDFATSGQKIAKFQIEKFITTTFKKRTCKRFVPDKSWSIMCGCGYTSDQHTDISAADTTEKWEFQTHTETSATDAYGDVEFANSGKKIAKYIRVDCETEIADLVKLLFDYWKMDTPRLLISVVGGAQDYTMEPRLQQVFCQGLVRAAESLHTWIITDGTNTGVTKYVGKALRDYTIKHGRKKQLVALGIATWGCIANRDDLIPLEVRNDKSKESYGCWPASYKVTDSPDKEEECLLDPNHTHFILVDNGTQEQGAVEIELREQLEIEISKKTSDEESDSIPMVCAVLGGGPGTLKTVKEAVINGTPVIIVKDSGGAAAVLAFVYGKWQQHKGQIEMGLHSHSTAITANVHFEREVSNEIKERFGSGLDIEKYVGYIRDCVENFDLLSIFHLESGSSARDIDFAILNAVLKVNRGIDQLWLALTLDGIDAAKDKIFTDGANFEKSKLADLMLFAIQNNRVAFVKLFLEKGMRTFLKSHRFENRFKKLYREIRTTKQKEIESLQKDFRVKLFADDRLEANPLLALFLWSVLTMRREMALIFLSERQEYLALVVAAHLISRTLLREDPDSELNKELSEQVTFYEELSVDLLNECHSSDRRKSTQLLVREIPAFGRTSVLKMAVQAENKNFIAQPACQNLLTDAWTGKLSDDNHNVKLLIAIFCPFVAPRLLKFRYNSTFRSVWATDDSSATGIENSSPPSSQPTYFKKLSYFFQAPETKFSYNFLSHLVFLLLYGLILLTDFYPKIGIKEKILIAWVATLIVEEIRQIIINDEYDLRQKLYNYITDIWNIMDVITIVTFLAGMILRFIPVSFCGHCFYAARIILALNFMTFSFRILHVFSIHRELGPKLVMIGNMMIDLFYFMIILLVFIAAYGTASHVVLYPNQPLNIALARDVLGRSFWNIFGELGIEEVSGAACDNRTVLPYAEQCASMDADEFSSYGCGDYKEDKCPSIDWLVPIILAIYVLITNVLMFNLLIAMFSNTFSNIQVQTNVVWKMQRYHLVREYESRPILPPPLIILAHVYLLIRCYIGRQNRGLSPNARNEFRRTSCFKLTSSEERESNSLLDWESLNAEEYLRKIKFDYQAPDSNDTSDVIVKKLEEMSNNLSRLGNKVDTLKEENEEITRALKEITRALEITRAPKEEMTRNEIEA